MRSNVIIPQEQAPSIHGTTPAGEETRHPPVTPCAALLLAPKGLHRYEGFVRCCTLCHPATIGATESGVFYTHLAEDGYCRNNCFCPSEMSPHIPNSRYNRRILTISESTPVCPHLDYLHATNAGTFSKRRRSSSPPVAHCLR